MGQRGHHEHEPSQHGGPALFATAAKGTEGALRDELRERGFRGVRADRGGVAFAGDVLEGARACLELRIAVRVLLELGHFPARDADELYAGVSSIDWAPFVSPDGTLAVRVAGTHAQLVHSQFTARRTKDAIVDALRRRFGRRPSVDLDAPDLLVFVHLKDEHARVYADIAGESLHRRGYRTRIGDAPLKENLAAALLRLSGWDRRSPLLDPLCGAGTIAIEAAQWAQGRAPGVDRALGAARWPLWDDTLRRRYDELVGSARARPLAASPPIYAFDADDRAAAATEANARDAGTPLVIGVRDARRLDAPDALGAIVTNPPYGERLEGGLSFYRDLARSLHALRPHRLALLAGSPDIRRAFGEPRRWVAVRNGPLPCEVLVYEQPARGPRE